jgi:hypothetical protein
LIQKDSKIAALQARFTPAWGGLSGEILRSLKAPGLRIILLKQA